MARQSKVRLIPFPVTKHRKRRLLPCFSSSEKIVDFFGKGATAEQADVLTGLVKTERAELVATPQRDIVRRGSVEQKENPARDLSEECSKAGD